MKKLLKSGRFVRTLALFLSVILFGTMFVNITLPVLSSEWGATPVILLDDEVISETVMDEGAKLRFEADYEGEAIGYCWQIKDPLHEERWIDISDGYSKYLWVTHALIGSMLYEDNSAYLRCRVQTQNGKVFTDPVRVTVSLHVPSEDDGFQYSTPATYKLSRASEEPEMKTYSVVINYLFDNNTIAFEPFGATIASGEPFHKIVESPDIMGYAPFRRDGEDYVDASKVEIDIDSIDSNITINVIYEPKLMPYKVHHHFQHIEDDDYSITADRITERMGLTGSIVEDNLAFTAEEEPGFKSLAYERLPVAADGSTVVEIRYDRNYYLVDFDMNGGYGTEPVYTRYGAAVGANIPVRHGYVFDGWELVSYGGNTPTSEQQSLYYLAEGTTITVPAASLRYRARWITQETTYTMVFWREDADGNGYSYWGYLDDIAAMSGTEVDGQDYIAQVAGIDDEQYFTFNPLKTEKNVLVEGDGSTVVNVYYTRNYYTITFKANAKCAIPVNHSHGDACYDFICGKEHQHDSSCVSKLECTKPEHIAHTAECIICGKTEHIHGSADCDCTLTEHTHSVNCWEDIGTEQTSGVSGAPSNPEEGQIYSRYVIFSGTRYYIYIGGTWYRYNGRGASSGDIVDPACGLTSHKHGTDCECGEDAHAHTAACYRDTLHKHDEACYSYSCGEDEHIHESGCRRLICGITEGHTHNTNCTNTSRSNTVKTVYKKYDESIKHIWPITDDNGVTYNDGQRWAPSNSSYYNEVLVYIEQMPPDDFTLTLSTTTNSTYTMNYYLQVLPGETTTVPPKDGYYYVLDNTILAKYGYVTKAEDFFDIHGFYQYDSDPDFGSNGQINSSKTVNFYYNRITDHKLEFNNNGTVLSDKTVTGVMYGASLTTYNFVPPYPENLEPNAYTFAGWYISPGCFDGTEVDWENLTSPEGDLMLYAKWVPITHRVRIYLDDTFTEQLGTEQIVAHKAFAHAPNGNVSNGNYTFQGWFYKDLVGGVEVEKAFSFSGIPVLEDMDIYAKWGSHVSVDYKIYYKLLKTDEEIAPATIGSAIAGNNKTFEAKAGNELNPEFRVGYYPMQNSHTITMSVDGTREFTFYYVYVESMPYKVRYLNADTGEALCEDKLVLDNSLSVVTETFRRFDKMMPDTYQKRLVLSAEIINPDANGISEANIITFYYASDEEHAYYRVVHHIQNISGDTYREYSSEEAVGTIGDSYSVNTLALTGFEIAHEKTCINGVVTPTEGNAVTATLTADGLLVEFFYDRKTYHYAVEYVNSKTGETLLPAKYGTGVFGVQIAEYAEDLTPLGYELVKTLGVAETVKTLTISSNEEHNLIRFLYQEMTVAFKYEVVGPEGCGSLSQESENVTAKSGQPDGSTPYINKGFTFVGWFMDQDCTTPVNAEWVDAETHTLKPQKTQSVWHATTYYAMFAALETDLTITTKSTPTVDADQVFIFNIKGKADTDVQDINLFVTVQGNSSVIVTKLPVGEYTVTELVDWSWRYDNSAAAKEIKLAYNNGLNEIVFDNSRNNGKWLDGNAVKDNQF